jgi:hypothetical protein
MFAAGAYLPTVVYYIHHDGYLEGAAHYFKEAVLYENHRGGLPAMFLRANDNAEFTESHQTHGDTAFRYTVMPGEPQLLAEKRSSHNTENWHQLFHGSLVDFIRQYEGTQLTIFRGVYVDRERAVAKVLERLADLKHMLEGGHTGNASSVAHEVWELNQRLIEVWGDDEFTQTTAKTIDSADRYFSLAYGWPKQLGVDEEEAYRRWVQTFRTPKPLTLEAPQS